MSSVLNPLRWRHRADADARQLSSGCEKTPDQAQPDLSKEDDPQPPATGEAHAEQEGSKGAHSHGMADRLRALSPGHWLSSGKPAEAVSHDPSHAEQEESKGETHSHGVADRLRALSPGQWLSSSKPHEEGEGDARVVSKDRLRGLNPGTWFSSSKEHARAGSKEKAKTAAPQKPATQPAKAEPPAPKELQQAQPQQAQPAAAKAVPAAPPTPAPTVSTDELEQQGADPANAAELVKNFKAGDTVYFSSLCEALSNNDWLVYGRAGKVLEIKNSKQGIPRVSVRFEEQKHTERVLCSVTSLSLEKPAVLPGDFEAWTTAYYTGIKRKVGKDDLLYANMVTILGPAKTKDLKSLTVRYMQSSGELPIAFLSKTPPQALPGGYIADERTRYVGREASFACNKRLSPNQMGTIIGPAFTKDATRRALSVIFDGFESHVECFLSTLAHVDEGDKAEL